MQSIKEALKEVFEHKNKVNLGCPYKCKGWICVDIKPLEDGVIEMDVYDYLKTHGEFDEIKSKNLVEHLTNTGLFFELCYEALKEGGNLKLITDNAEFLPFYIPILFKLGWGAHASNRYRTSMNKSKHYCIFTKLHLRNLAEDYGFKVIKINRMLRYGFARLMLKAVKPSGGLVNARDKPAPQINM